MPTALRIRPKSTTENRMKRIGRQWYFGKRDSGPPCLRMPPIAMINPSAKRIMPSQNGKYAGPMRAVVPIE
jgi:hypothetical protein